MPNHPNRDVSKLNIEGDFFIIVSTGIQTKNILKQIKRVRSYVFRN
jgi:hypothetical protein